MAQTLSVEEISHDFEAYFKLVENDGERIIVTIDGEPMVEIRPILNGSEIGTCETSPVWKAPDTD